ncbi:MAG: MbnP family protein [Crocinitomicaceae bacterium]|tara:strand:+ start:90 stop:1037 length:948 start_codon:yes stop_codon:yes gene_type:complete
MKLLYTLCLLFFVSLISFGQKGVFLNLNPVFLGVPLEIGTTYTHPSDQSFSIDYLNYYVSDVIITHDGGQEITAMPSVFLATIESHTLFLGNHDVQNVEHIEFTLGVPERFNTQDGAEAIDISSYPADHPLSFQDPGMYWGWAFGYMHVVTAGMPFFELHNVGPQLAKQVSLDVIPTETSSNQIDIELFCNVDRWFNSIEFSEMLVSHGAGPENVQMMSNLLTDEVFSVSAQALIPEYINTQAFVYQNSEGLNVANIPSQAKFLRVTDQLGRLVESQNISGASTLTIDVDQKGVVFVCLSNQEGTQLETIKYIIP